jgi:hypothetical protein
MATSNINTAWKNDLYPLISTQFYYSFDDRSNLLKQIISEENTKSIDYRLAGMGGFGEVPLYTGELTTMNQKRGFVKIIPMAQRAAAIDIERMYAMTDKSGECKRVGVSAGDSLAATIYLDILRLYGRAFNTNYTGGDGQPWASASHPVASKGDASGVSVIDTDAGTYSNLITTALSVAAITAAQTASNRFLNPDGTPYLADYINNGILLVSPELESKARELCGPNGKLTPERIPESAENGANPIYGLKYLVVGGGNDGFSAKQWAIADIKKLAAITKIVYVEKPTVLETNLDNPLIARYVPYAAYGMGFGDARPITFSNPA